MKQGNGVTRGGRVFCFFLLVLLVGCGSSERAGADMPARRLGPDQHFVLKNLKGEEVKFDDVLQAHKAVLLNFWATWCPPCREEIPDLVELQAKHQNDSFTVLGVDVGESGSKVGAFAEKMKMNYPLLLDSEMQVAESYKVVGIPTSLLVTPEGTILGEYHGYTRRLVSDVEKALQ